MGIGLQQLMGCADELLEPARFSDYCPNGLQVEGRARVENLVSGVTACQGLIDAAVELGADAILVHHGLFWSGDEQVLRGMKKRRVAALLAADISLLAYHLPLDAHPEFGNNATLARLLEIEVEGSLEPGNPASVGNVGSFSDPLPIVPASCRAFP